MAITVSMAPATPFPGPSSMVETTAIEVGSVVSFKEGTIVTVVNPVAIVTIPGRVVIIDISGVFGFTNSGRCIVAAAVRGSLIVLLILIDRRRFLVDRCGRSVNGGRCDIHAGARDTEADVSVYVYLRIAFGSDEASGYNCGDH